MAAAVKQQQINSAPGQQAAAATVAEEAGMAVLDNIIPGISLVKDIDDMIQGPMEEAPGKALGIAAGLAMDSVLPGSGGLTKTATIAAVNEMRNFAKDPDAQKAYKEATMPYGPDVPPP